MPTAFGVSCRVPVCPVTAGRLRSSLWSSTTYCSRWPTLLQPRRGSKRGTAWLRSRAAVTPAGARPTGLCRSVRRTSNWSRSSTRTRPRRARSDAGSRQRIPRSPGCSAGPSARMSWTISPDGSTSPWPPAHGPIGTANMCDGGWPASTRPPPSPRSLSSSSGNTGPHFQAAPRQPIAPAPSKSQRYSSTATPIASPPGSALTASPSPCAQVRLPSPASSSPELPARSSSTTIGCNGPEADCPSARTSHLETTSKGASTQAAERRRRRFRSLLAVTVEIHEELCERSGDGCYESDRSELQKDVDHPSSCSDRIGHLRRNRQQLHGREEQRVPKIVDLASAGLILEEPHQHRPDEVDDANEHQRTQRPSTQLTVGCRWPAASELPSLTQGLHHARIAV